MTVTVGWIAYVLAVSALIAAAARAAAAALRLLGRPLRWVWAAGLAATAAAPLAPRVLPSLVGPGAGVAGTPPGGSASVSGVLRPDAAEASADGAVAGALTAASDLLAVPVPDALATGLAAAWAAGTLALVVTLAGGWLRLRRRCREWPEGRAAGEDVRVSRGTGPAAAGILRPVVIVPAWLLRRGGRDVRMAVVHEREHARARDPALLAAGRALAALVPWNPFLWLQLRRLRLAVELDCDRRVLRRGHRRRDYGRLLLEVSASPSGGFLRPAATLSERSTHLEERIRAMTSESTSRFRALRAMLLVGVSLGLVAGACETPPPPAPADGGGDAAEVSADREAGGEEASADDADVEEPGIEDRRQVMRALARSYPPALREAGVGGVVSLRLRVGPDGRVNETNIEESSGHPKLDAAAREAIASTEYEPATRDGEPVAAWVTQRVTFAVQGPDSSAPGVTVEGGTARLRIEPDRDHVLVSGVTPGDRERAEIHTDEVRLRNASGADAPGGRTTQFRGDTPPETQDWPLTYIDGERVTGDDDSNLTARLNEIDPDDIESIRVLKVDRAVAEYGPDAASGVLLITTKDGTLSSG